MTDIEMVKLCAQALGLTITGGMYRSSPASDVPDQIGVMCGNVAYMPLEDDAQAMALVKRFGLDVEYLGNTGYARESGNNWLVTAIDDSAKSADLNRAIVETVAQMQAAKVTT